MITVCCRLETKTDPQVTRMTQKFEFIATRTIEKPPMKSSTYYSTVESGRHGDLPDPGLGPDRPTDTGDNDSLIPGTSEDDRQAAEAADAPETVDEVSAAQRKKEKLSEKFRKWQEDELKLYSDSELQPQGTAQSSSTPPHESLDSDWNEALQPDTTGAASSPLDSSGAGQTSEVVGSDDREGEPPPTMLSGQDHETLDLSDDMLQRNLVESDRADDYDMFEEPDATSSKVVDGAKDDDEEQDIDFSQVVERNLIDRAEEKQPLSADSQPVNEPSLDRVEHKSSQSVGRRISRDLSQLQKEASSADGKELYVEGPPTEKPLVTADFGEVLEDLQEKFPATTDSGEVLGSHDGAVAVTRVEEIGVPEERAVEPVDEIGERAIRPDQLAYEDQLRLLARDEDAAVHQEVDKTVNSRELETTDEIVVETKVTEVKTVLMHLGESGNISVMETTEVKTDTDMKETKKILERDEVAVTHRKQQASDYVPLSPSPSPAGSLRSRTPDRHSPSLTHGDSVEKLTESDLVEGRDPVADIRPGLEPALYVAICPYEPETEDVMSLHEGEFLDVLEDTAEDWWLVRKSFDSREGYVPAQYLRDKHADDRMIEDEVAKQMELKIYVDSSKTLFSGIVFM